MKILHSVLSLDMGGAHVSAVKIACGMKKLGMEVFLSHSPYGGRENKTHPSLLEHLRKHGVRTLSVRRLRRRPCLHMDLAALLETALLVRRLKPDVVNTHSVKPALFMSVISPFIPATKLVHTLRGFAAEKAGSVFQSWLFQKMEDLIARSCHGLVTLSPLMADRVKKVYNTGDSSIEVIRSGFDLDHIRSYGACSKGSRARMGLPESKPVVGSVTALVEEKGIMELGQAFLQIGKKNPDVHFVLVGDGPLRESLLEIVAPLGERLHFFGLQADTAPFYALMDCLVLSSRSEGLPRVIVEAFCCSVPVVSTDVGAVRELVIDGKTGFLVSPESPEQLAGKVLYLLKNRAESIEFGMRGNRMIDDDFGLDRVIGRYLELYREVLREDFQ